MNKIWTEEEDKILEENYPTMGVKVTALLPGRSEYACRYRACMLDIKSNCAWTYEDDQLLREKYPTMGGNVYILFKGRHNKSSCYTRASFLGVKKNKKQRIRKREML